MRIECLIGMLNDNAAPLMFTDAAQAQGRIGNPFIAASAGDIDLVMRTATTVPGSLPAGFPVTALDLHVALTRLVGIPKTIPVTRVGLLLASFYKPFPKALGVMFDRGMPTIDDPNPAAQFTGVPR